MMCGGDFMSNNSEEAMDFLSYVAEVSREWDEPNAREVGRMKSQPNASNAKTGMYTVNENIDMKAKFAAMVRRLEELEMKKIREVHAISETPVQVMSCSICQSFEHLVEECPTILAVREMFGDQANYMQPGQAPPQTSNLEQAIVNLSKVIGDFVGDQKSINAQLSQRIDMQEKGKFPSQPHKNPKGIHEVEAQEGESSQVREVKVVITLRSGKEVDLPTSKSEHEPESETEKEKREEIKGKRKRNSAKKEDLNLL
ncbi:hypothetical protein CK203_015789 [Vitis vinifera]|uniref:Retrotransposon gag domain-containing protein n=1 Tax=Vitis vinifera TaxID=29760 RepID=A0A438JRH7_VITVI|nr:hypothetical protein CK203_015789 [Vitis vinifera]